MIEKKQENCTINVLMYINKINKQFNKYLTYSYGKKFIKSNKILKFIGNY